VGQFSYFSQFLERISWESLYYNFHFANM